MRLIFVPQYPAPLRYQEWWMTEFEKEFKKEFDEVVVLGKDFMSNDSVTKYTTNFSPLQKSIEFECQQVQEYLNLKIRKDDILFLSDISYPGIFLNILFHKRTSRMYCFCHATALNKYDYYKPVRKVKYATEIAISKLFDTVFLGSYYHQSKLRKWSNTRVVYVPKPPFPVARSSKKVYDIVTLSRDCIQKRTKTLEKFVNKTFGKIVTPPDDTITWQDYFGFISKAKVVLVTSKEETFGYQVLDAVMNDAIPICPNKFSFPELLERQFLYDPYVTMHGFKPTDDLYYTLARALDFPPPKTSILCQKKIDNFYKNIIRVMKGEDDGRFSI